MEKSRLMQHKFNIKIFSTLNSFPIHKRPLKFIIVFKKPYFERFSNNFL